MMKAAINCKLLTTLFVITFVNADFMLEIFSGGPVPLGPLDANVTVGNITETYKNLTSDDLKATTNARIVAELLRRMFPVGIYPLPPLDPYTNDKLIPYVLPSDSVLSGKIYFNSVQIKGAQKFFLDTLTLRMQTNRLDYYITIPRLTVDVDFKADLLFSKFVPIVFEGTVRLILDGVDLLGAQQLERNVVPVTYCLQVTGANVNLHADSVTAQFFGKQLESKLLRSLDTVAEDRTVSVMMYSVREHVEEFVLQAAIDEVNEVLRHLSVAQVEAYLLCKSPFVS